MTEIEQFLANQELYRCELLSANLTKSQCRANRQSGRILSCDGCKGLGISIVIKPTQIVPEIIPKPTDLRKVEGVEMSKHGKCVECGKEHTTLVSRGLCNGCYGKKRKEEGNPIRHGSKTHRKCVVDGCDKYRVTDDKCIAHYKEMELVKPYKTGTRKPEQLENQGDVDRAVSKKPTKPTKTATCFFCASVEEQSNNVGEIRFNDGDSDHNIYVCHYCASESLKDLLKNADISKLPLVLGELMYRRALDSRSY